MTILTLLKNEAMYVRLFHEAMDKGDDLTASRYRHKALSARQRIDLEPHAEHEIKLVRGYAD